MKRLEKTLKTKSKAEATASKSAVGSKAYLSWIGELKKRYRATQIKAAVAVNAALIEFYWNLGKDISEKYPGYEFATTCCKLSTYHLEELALPMGISNYELKKVLPTQEQIAKCYADAEAQFNKEANSRLGG